LRTTPSAKAATTTILGGAAVAWPLAARAQQGGTPVIGWLGGESRQADENFSLVPFRQGLKQADYIEGRNLTIEYRFAEGQYDRLPALAAELVRRQVSVIVINGLPAALAPPVESARRSRPADGCLAHAVGSGEIGLHSAFR
jgi:putative tryptophan/tyrosine transport system substrate-binding protein